jgi:hypothetical protein
MREEKNEERRENIIYTKDLGYLYWVIRVGLGWVSF